MAIAVLSATATADAGWGVFTVNYVKALAKYRDDFVLFLPSGHEKVDFIPPEKVKNVLPNVGDDFSLSALIKLRGFDPKAFRDYSIVHVLTDNSLAYLGARISQKYKSRLILTCQGTFAVRPFRSPIYSGFQRNLMRSAQTITCPSQFTRSAILAFTDDFDLAEKLRVVRNGIDFEFFHDPVPHPKPGDEFRLIAVGHLKPRKGHDILLRALAKLIDSYPQLCLKIVGKGDAAALRALASRLGIEKHVEFLGFLSDVDLRQALWSSHAYIHTPINRDWRFEGFGLVYLEANAAGLPAIGSRSGGVPDAVLDGKTGLLAEEADVASTAEAIQKLIDNPDLRQRLARNGITWAKHHDWSCVIQDFLPLYQ